MGRALGVAALLVSVAYIPGVSGAGFTSRWLVLAIVSVLLFGVAHIRETPALRWGIALLAYAAISIAFEPVFWEGLNGYIQLLILGLIFLLGSQVEDLRPVYAGLALGITINLGFVIAQMLGKTPVLWVNVPAGLFVNRAFLGEAAALAVVGALVSRLWWLVPGPLVCVALSQSRGSWIALGAAGGVWAWRKHWGFGLAIVLALPIAAYLMATYGRWFGPVERIYLWRDTLDGLSIFGNGIGSFYTMVPAYGHRLEGIVREAHAHNDPLELAFELGAPGVIACAAILFAAFRAPDRPGDKLVLVTFLVEGLAGFPAHMPATGFVGFVVAGGLCGHRYRLWKPVDLGAIRKRIRMEFARKKPHRVASDARGREVVSARLHTESAGSQYVMGF
jgi:hypothetical protein